MPDYSPYQKKLISRYYEHKDVILLNRLQELVSELFLAETDRKRDQLWNRAQKAMTQLKVPAAVAEHILKTRRADVLARNLEDWLKNAKDS
ncbi:MAG: hypothetical protein V3T70_07405 [Phycisphaerae bacterium]